MFREANQLAAQYRREREGREREEEEHYRSPRLPHLLIPIMMMFILILHLRQLMLAKFAEDDKLDQMNAQRRRMK